MTACGSNPPLVTHSAAVPAVNNSGVITPAVPANTSGGNPWPTTSVGQGMTYGSKQSTSLQSVSPTVTVGSAGDATTVHMGHFPSPGVDGIQCSVGDIWDEIKFKVRATRTLEPEPSNPDPRTRTLEPEPEPKTRAQNPSPKPEPKTRAQNPTFTPSPHVHAVHGLRLRADHPGHPPRGRAPRRLPRSMRHVPPELLPPGEG